jgi:hypothetical protein
MVAGEFNKDHESNEGKHDLSNSQRQPSACTWHAREVCAVNGHPHGVVRGRHVYGTPLSPYVHIVMLQLAVHQNTSYVSHSHTPIRKPEELKRRQKWEK